MLPSKSVGSWGIMLSLDRKSCNPAPSQYNSHCQNHVIIHLQTILLGQIFETAKDSVNYFLKLISSK